MAHVVTLALPLPGPVVQQQQEDFVDLLRTFLKCCQRLINHQAQFVWFGLPCSGGVLKAPKELPLLWSQELRQKVLQNDSCKLLCNNSFHVLCHLIPHYKARPLLPGKLLPD